MNGLLKEYGDKRHMDKTRSKLTETTLITPTSIDTQMRQSIKTGYIHVFNRTKNSFEAIALKLIFRYYNTLAAGLHTGNVHVTGNGCYFAKF